MIPNSELRLRASLVALIGMIVFVLPVCAQSSTSRKVTTTLKTELAGSFFLNTGDSSTSEWVDLSGSVHLVVQAIPPNPVTPPSPIRVHTNMAGVTGIGRSSGLHFVLNGSENFDLDGDVPDTLDFLGQYRFIPPNPVVPPSPIMPVNFTIQVDANGIATGATVQVGECTTDVCDE